MGADGQEIQAEITKLIVAFRNFANEPKNNITVSIKCLHDSHASYIIEYSSVKGGSRLQSKCIQQATYDRTTSLHLHICVSIMVTVRCGAVV